jgi:hypothetical protein
MSGLDLDAVRRAQAEHRARLAGALVGITPEPIEPEPAPDPERERWRGGFDGGPQGTPVRRPETPGETLMKALADRTSRF